MEIKSPLARLFRPSREFPNHTVTPCCPPQITHSKVAV
jgi:hypothetical protein